MLLVLLGPLLLIVTNIYSGCLWFVAAAVCLLCCCSAHCDCQSVINTPAEIKKEKKRASHCDKIKIINDIFKYTLTCFDCTECGKWNKSDQNSHPVARLWHLRLCGILHCRLSAHSINDFCTSSQVLHTLNFGCLAANISLFLMSGNASLF